MGCHDDVDLPGTLRFKTGTDQDKSEQDTECSGLGLYLRIHRSFHHMNTEAVLVRMRLFYQRVFHCIST